MTVCENCGLEQSSGPGCHVQDAGSSLAAKDEKRGLSNLGLYIRTHLFPHVRGGIL